MKRTDFDAIVVGSGTAGGWAAKELTERGLETLVLERGRHVEHGRDYVTEHAPVYNFKFRLLGDRRRYAMEYPVQSRSAAWYSHPPDRPFTWIRGHQLGGRSITWVTSVTGWPLSISRRRGRRTRRRLANLL